MPFEFKYIEEPHISLVTFTGKITPEDVNEAAVLSTQALDRSTDGHYMISDLSQKPTFAFNALKTTGANQLMKHPHFGWIVIIGLNPVVNFWLEILGHTIHLKFKVFRTLEEGLEFIKVTRELEAGQLPTQAQN